MVNKLIAHNNQKTISKKLHKQSLKLPVASVRSSLENHVAPFAELHPINNPSRPESPLIIPGARSQFVAARRE